MNERVTAWGEDIEPEHFSSMEEFLGRDRRKSGLIEIAHNEAPLQLSWEFRGSGTTLVMFGGAVRNKVLTVPVFSGRKVTANLKANVLMLSDSSLRISRNLGLGWYAGSREHPDLQLALNTAIKSLSANDRIVLFGSSGGGYAALDQAARLYDATAVVVNPQTDILRYHEPAVARYLKFAWGEPMTHDHDDVPVRSSVVDTYSNALTSNVLYLQNDSDEFHIENHATPFFNSIHPQNAFHELRLSVGTGHVGPAAPKVEELLKTAIANSDWEALKRRVNAIQWRDEPKPHAQAAKVVAPPELQPERKRKPAFTQRVKNKIKRTIKQLRG